MFWINFKRVIKSGWVNFRRNGLVSSAAVLVTMITLCVVMGLFLFHTLLVASISTIEDKVDIAVYFNVDAPEDQILALKAALEQQPEVASVTYQSADQEVEAFRDRHSDDYLTLEALDEVGDNPFGGYIEIKAKDVSQYDAIDQLLEGDGPIAQQYAPIIERINYAQNESVIDRLNHLIDLARKYGLGVIVILSIISLVIMYTTIRLTIYMVRDEISIMKLVGASNMFIRLPFMVEGMLYGFFAWLLTISLFMIGTYLIIPYTTDLFGVNLFSYLLQHFFSVPLIVLAIGLGLGIISSLFAVRRYLKV